MVRLWLMSRVNLGPGRAAECGGPVQPVGRHVSATSVSPSSSPTIIVAPSSLRTRTSFVLAKCVADQLFSLHSETIDKIVGPVKAAIKAKDPKSFVSTGDVLLMWFVRVSDW